MKYTRTKTTQTLFDRDPAGTMVCISTSQCPRKCLKVLHPITWAAPEQTMRWNFLAESPGEWGDTVKLSQGRDNTHWANVYYLQSKYSFPLAAWASWTRRPPIWLDLLASEFQVSGCLCHHPLARLPSRRVRHQVWLSTALGSRLKTPCFHDKQLTNELSPQQPLLHITYFNCFFSSFSFHFCFFNFPDYPLRDDWCSISTCCNENTCFCTQSNIKFFTNNLIKNFQAELVSTQRLHPYCLAFLVLGGTTHNTRRQR